MVLRGPWTKVFSWQCEFGPGRPTPDSQTWLRYLSKKWPVLHCWWAGPCEYSILDSNSEFFVSTRTEHYSDRVVSIINSRIFTIISTINQRQLQVGLDDDHDQILACQKIRSEWLPNMRRRTLSLYLEYWEESLLALNPLLFLIQHFPFLNMKHNSKANFELF